MIRWAVALAWTAISHAATAETVLAHAIQLRDEGKGIEALQEFRRAATLNPRLPNVHREIGLILLDRRDFNGAVSAFRRAVQTDGSDLNSRYNLALSLANAGRTQEGIKELRSILKEQPQWGLAWFGLGHIQAPAEGEQSLRRAVQLDKSLYRAWFELSKILEDKGDRSGAIEALSEGLRVAPNSPEMRFRLAKLLRQTGRTEEAAQEFSKTRELRDQKSRGEQAASAYIRGLDYLRQQNFEAAVKELRRALDLRPDFPETRAALAEACENQGHKSEEAGDLRTATASYAAALEVAPTAELANHIGVLMAKSNRPAEAIGMFRRALELKPGYLGAAKNLEQALQLYYVKK